MDANFMQQRMQELQQTDAIADVFGKLISGKSGYKAVLDKKEVIIKCPKCQTTLDSRQKFCHECGTKNEQYKAS